MEPKSEFETKSFLAADSGSFEEPNGESRGSTVLPGGPGLDTSKSPMTTSLLANENSLSFATYDAPKSW
jgi:hypothetical protein